MLFAGFYAAGFDTVEWRDRAGKTDDRAYRILRRKVLPSTFGPRYPGLSREAGVAQVVSVLKSLLPVAEKHGVVLTMENHYKDSFWQYPEFAQKMDVFLEIVGQIDSPWFGVNYDPSNTVLAGEDPIELLNRIKHRVVSMHASDRYLASGTIEDLRQEENEMGMPAGWPMASLAKGLTTMTRFSRFCVRLNLIRGFRLKMG